MTNPAPAGTDSYTNTVSVSDDGRNGADPTPDNNASSDTDVLSNPAPGLRVEKTDGQVEVAPSQALTYVVTVQNAGNIGVSNVFVSDTLPAGVVYLGCQTTGTVAIACAEAGGVVTATFATLAGGGAIATLAIDVEVVSPAPPSLVSLTNIVVVSDDGSNGVDDPSDNMAMDVDVVDAAPDMSVVKPRSTVWSLGGGCSGGEAVCRMSGLAVMLGRGASKLAYCWSGCRRW